MNAVQAMYVLDFIAKYYEPVRKGFNFVDFNKLDKSQTLPEI
jgi:hypothetical protein